ncbi:MAG TPA: hypothetical protein VEA99_09950 [Gemmatimonadaceae bacterium]|nr:hypothetical protein [Gemmatimonadaceae bacterium]
MTDEIRPDGKPERQGTGNASTREDATLREGVLEDSPAPEVAREGKAERARREREQDR